MSKRLWGTEFVTSNIIWIPFLIAQQVRNVLKITHRLGLYQGLCSASAFGETKDAYPGRVLVDWIVVKMLAGERVCFLYERLTDYCSHEIPALRHGHTRGQRIGY